MELQPDLIVEQNKEGRLPRSLNFAIILNKFPFPISIEINHNKFQDPTITLFPVKEKKGGGD